MSEQLLRDDLKRELMFTQSIKDLQDYLQGMQPRPLSTLSSTEQVMLRLAPSLEELLKMAKDLNENSYRKHRPLQDFSNESNEQRIQGAYRDSMEERFWYGLNTLLSTHSFKE